MIPSKQRGGTLAGLLIGVVVGLGIALAVAAYVSKVPVPFMNNGSRLADPSADNAQRGKNWDPNAPLYGKNPAGPGTGATPAPEAPAVSGQAPATAPASDDPLGDLARARTAAPASAPPAAAAPAPATAEAPYAYFIQAGAFRAREEADAQRAQLAMLGWEARVSEREQNGRTVFRVRVGPFAKRDDAESLKEKLDGAGVDSALVRVQR